MWHSPHWKLTGNWQKDSCTTKAVRMIDTHNQVGREEKWQVQDLCFWEGTQRKREITWAQTVPREGVWTTDRAPQHWGPTQERGAPSAGWRTAETNRKAVGLHLWGACVCWPAPKQGGESRLKTMLVVAGFSQLPQPVHQPKPSECSRSTCSTSQHGIGYRTAMTREKTQLWITEVTWCQSGTWVGWWRPLLAFIQAVHQKHPRTLTAVSQPTVNSSPHNTCQESMYVLPALRCRSTMGEGQQRLWGVIGCERQRGLGPKAVSEQGKGNNFWCLHRQCIRGSLDICLWLTWAERPHMPPCFSMLHLWGKDPGVGRGKAHTWREQEPAWG